MLFLVTLLRVGNLLKIIGISSILRHLQDIRVNSMRRHSLEWMLLFTIPLQTANLMVVFGIRPKLDTDITMVLVAIRILGQ